MSAICLGDVFSRALRVLLGNRCFVSGLLAISATTTAVKTVTNTITYCIDGVLYSLAPTDPIAFTDVHKQDVATTCFYAVCVDSGGTPVIVNGTPVLTALITAGTSKATFPEISDNLCLIGGVKVETDTTHTFTPGTTALSAAGITDTYYNFSCAPTLAYA
jgi:hypothetical protein